MWVKVEGGEKEEEKRKKKKKKKVGENNGQLCFRPPPRVAHASRLDQFLTNIFVFLGKFPYNFDYI